MYKNSNISNCLISVKENSSLQEASFMSSEKIVDEGVLSPLDKLLSSVFGKSVTVTREENKQVYKDDF